MKTNSQKLIDVRQLKLQFGKKEVLKDVNFSLQPEEVLVIMGLSGCGKSTILKIIMGLLKESGGSVFFKDQELTKLSRPELNQARTHIGMVYQNAALVSSMTVRDNLALPLKELTLKKDQEIDSVIDQKLEQVGLKDVKDLLPSELSGGMQKRVGLARALMMEPELILFDEPSAGLDPVNSKLIDDLIIKLRDEQKVASIVVTHEMKSAFQIASRIAFLHEGKVIFEGSSEDFQKSKDPTIHQFVSSYSEEKKQPE
ncbi:MAG: ATP-binding cassette domain-containing protein [Verrucomicrobiota bacterium]